MEQHRIHLLESLKFANLRRGFCAPNPAVGALIVRDNQIISTGFHYTVGHPHAEVAAIQNAEGDLQDATLYVSLEPCNHWGKTPPCTELILARGIKNIVYGYRDPNSFVTGGGEIELRKQGATCIHVPLNEINEFYKSYEYWLKTQRPFVTAKLAMSIDAKIASPLGEPIAITGIDAKNYTHSWRQKRDAILTTARTVSQDDPSLNVRLETETIAKPIYVLDSQLSLPLNAKILKTAQSLTLFHKQNIPQEKIKVLHDLGVICRPISEDNHKLNLVEVLEEIGRDGKHDLWVEAGGELFTALIQQKLVHKSLMYVAPKLLGENAYPAFRTRENILANALKINWFNVGEDSVCELDWL